CRAVAENVRSEPCCFDTGLLQSTTGDPANRKRRQWSKWCTMPYKKRAMVAQWPCPLEVSHNTTSDVVGKRQHSFSFCFPGTDDQSSFGPVNIVQAKACDFPCAQP